MPAHRSTLALLLAGSVAGATLAAVPATTTAAAPAKTAKKTPKSLLIGIDGAMLDKIEEADAPHLQALIATGTSSLSYRYGSAPAELTQEGSTVSGAGWSTVLTGVWPDKHGVADNSFSGKDYETWPDYLTRAERLDPDLETYAVADWEPIAMDSGGGAIISDEIDRRVGMAADRDGQGYVVDDELSTQDAVTELATGDDDLSFFYLGKTDIAGHEHGSADPGFLASLEADDAQIGRVLDAIESRPTYASEDWQVIVVNDHGHTPTGGHGGNTLAEREQFVIAAGGGVPTGPRRDDLNVTDVVPTIYRHLGLPVAGGLDGTTIRKVRPDVFDSLRPRLGAAGWTARAPQGWYVDNDRMPAGGEPAFRGWTFMTNPTWSQFDASQGRENFVRGRGVLAVADSDEWDDVTHGPGPFDSTLVSQAYDVSDLRRARIRFQAFYQQEGDQRGRVLVSFDGGRPELLQTYAAHAYGQQRLSVAVPRKAVRMRVHFRYSGTNNWYWALDDVRVS